MKRALVSRILRGIFVPSLYAVHNFSQSIFPLWYKTPLSPNFCVLLPLLPLVSPLHFILIRFPYAFHTFSIRLFPPVSHTFVPYVCSIAPSNIRTIHNHTPYWTCLPGLDARVTSWSFHYAIVCHFPVPFAPSPVFITYFPISPLLFLPLAASREPADGNRAGQERGENQRKKDKRRKKKKRSRVPSGRAKTEEHEDLHTPSSASAKAPILLPKKSTF